MNKDVLGTVQTMRVKEKTEFGYILQMNDINATLHNDEATDDINVNDNIDVFLYNDKRKMFNASMTIPKISPEVYGWAKVKEVIPNLGVFVDIGTTKEILVSKDDLPLYENVWPVEGDKLMVKLGYDRRGRLLALPATEGIIEDEREWVPEEFMNQQVTGYVYFTSREGTALLTEEYYRGFIHHTERFEEPRLGQYVEGRVIDVKDDGTINVSLRPLKQESISRDAELILNHLKEQDGVIPFNDKSDPEDIRGTFNISKSAFKRALGRLMKQGLIEQHNGQTFLKANNDQS